MDGSRDNTFGGDGKVTIPFGNEDSCDDVVQQNDGKLTLLLLILLAFCVVAGIQAVGVVLTSALLVMPAAAAVLLTQRLVHMMALATIFVVVAGVVGLYASLYFNVSSGAAIVLTCTLIFALAWLVQHVRTTNLINWKG